MSTALPAHSTLIEVTKPLPPDVPVGADITVTVRVSCSAGCDLRHVPLKVVAPGGTTIASHFTIGDPDEFGQLQIKAPSHVGEHAWALVLPAQEGAGLAHLECAVPM